MLKLKLRLVCYSPKITATCQMRIVDLSRNSVIKAGMPWAFSGSPNSKNMICNLERNESLITWFQPNGGKITDQFPAIRIQEQYYTLSLRQMKAVWRWVFFVCFMNLFAI